MLRCKPAHWSRSRAACTFSWQDLREDMLRDRYADGIVALVKHVLHHFLRVEWGEGEWKTIGDRKKVQGISHSPALPRASPTRWRSRVTCACMC